MCSDNLEWPIWLFVAVLGQFSLCLLLCVVTILKRRTPVAGERVPCKLCI